jgi:serine phosphatase RsbU (regulator of sigma subunit)
MQTLRPNASAFCVALGRIASLALANLKRVDMERRTERTNNDLKAASIAAKMILPRRTDKIGAFEYVGLSKSSLYVGGDFFDVIQISPTRLAVALGDVSGKGVEASVLMTATLGFLRAALQSHGELSRASNELNQFIAPRRPDSKFVTMWLGVLDSEKHTISYVDAGHSYALVRGKDGKFKQLNEGGGLPIGVDETIGYNVETTPIKAGDSLLIVSDGIVEQYGMVQREDGSLGREHFEIAGVQKAWRANSADPIADLFAAVVAHAGTDQLSDDATAVLVRV